MPSANNGPYVRFRADEVLRLRVARLGLFYGNNASAFVKNRVLLHLQFEEQRLNCLATGEGVVGELRPSHDSVESLPADLREKYEELTRQIEALAPRNLLRPVLPNPHPSKSAYNAAPKKPAAKEKRAYRHDNREVSLSVWGGIPAGAPGEGGGKRRPLRTVKVKRGTFPAGAFGLDVRGDSMNAAKGPQGPILDGETVILVPRDDREPRDGDIVAALVDGQTTLKRLVCRPGKPCFLQPETTDPTLKGCIYPAAEMIIQGVFVAKLTAEAILL